MSTLVNVSDKINARIKEIQAIRKEALGRHVTVTEIMEILFENYDKVIEAENEQ